MTEKSISKKDKEIEIVRAKFLSLSGSIKEGDLVIEDGGSVYKVGKFSIDKNRIEGHQFMVELFHRSHGEWSHYGTVDFHEFEYGKYVKLDISSLEEFDAYEKKMLDEAVKFDDSKVEEVKENTETALALLNKEFLVKQKNDVENTRRHFQVLERVLNRKRHELSQYVRNMSEKIEKMNKIIGQIELYLGINEDIVQVQKGANADAKEPISLRQMILYMDEETGALLDEQGMDFTNIKVFDDWVTTKKNYNKLLPEKKGVVVLRVRRKDKDYGSDNYFVNAIENIPNTHTYLLIRNGDNLYRIWADIIIKPRLFPTQEEMDEIFSEKEEDFFRRGDREKKVFSYRQNLLLLQGLIDRTQVFAPLPLRINLFKPDSYGDFIKFIRDDEPSLTDGHMTYAKWKDELNSKIKRGTRIFFCGFRWRDLDSDKYSGYDYRRFPFRVDTKPHGGIYSIERIEQMPKSYYGGTEKLVCLYKPNDDVYCRYESHPRKKSIPFYLYRGDWSVLNYDLITVEEIDYFLNSRYDRGDYLEMLPVLYGIKKRRLEEMKWEEGFVDRLVKQFNCDEEIVWKAVVWWKAKVIWKRPIMEDDAKALRMITSKVKRMVENVELEN